MPFNGSGTFVREFNWTNDANNSIPISASRFDGEDNDFASGLSLCLTRDGQGAPTQALTWSQPLTINVNTDETVIAAGRTGGVNNPQLQLKVADATGASLNLSTAQTLSLTVNGATGASFSPTALALAIAGTNVISATASAITLAQTTTINDNLIVSPGAGLVAGTFNGAANQYAVRVNGSSTSGQSFGLTVVAGTTSADAAASFVNQANTATLFNLFGDGHGSIGYNGSGPTISFNAAGAVTINAPSAGNGLTTNGVAGLYASLIKGASTSGQSFGQQILAGTNSSDVALSVINQANTAGMLLCYGDGEVVVAQPTVATNTGLSSGSATVWQAGYLECPLNIQSANYSLAMTDRGKTVQMNAGTTLTIPANSSVAFPVGTVIMINNLTGANLAVNLTTDTLSWQPSLTTGNRTLAAGGIATLLKRASTTWVIWGFGLT